MRLLQERAPPGNRMTSSTDVQTVLGLETSCDETAAAVVRRAPDGTVEVLSSVIASQIAAHAPFGGVVPEIAARAHVESIDAIAAQALADAGVGLRGPDRRRGHRGAGPGRRGDGGPVVRQGRGAGARPAAGGGEPSGGPCGLGAAGGGGRLSVPAAAGLAAGIASCWRWRASGACRRLGSTIDDAAGEAFDKIAKTLGLPYPGGPALEALAAGGDPAQFELPRMLLGRKDCDFSFSGLKTAAARIAEGLTTEAERADLAAAVQAAIATQLAERSDRAMAALCGRARRRRACGSWWPAASRPTGRCAARLQAVAETRGFSFTAPPLAYCTDNAAMIALAGAERLALGMSDPLDAAARPRWPLDEAAASANPTHVPGRKGAKA